MGPPHHLPVAQALAPMSASFSAGSLSRATLTPGRFGLATPESVYRWRLGTRQSVPLFAVALPQLEMSRFGPRPGASLPTGP